MNKKQPWHDDRLCEQCGEIPAGYGCRHLYVQPFSIVHFFLLDVGTFAVKWNEETNNKGELFYILTSFKIVNTEWIGIYQEAKAHCEPDYNVSWIHLLNAIK